MDGLRKYKINAYDKTKNQFFLNPLLPVPTPTRLLFPTHNTLFLYFF